MDGRVIMANSQAYELVYFDAATGKQVKDNQRDTKARDAMSLGLPSLSCTCAHPPMPASPIYTLHLGSPDPPVTMTSDSDPCQPRPLSQWATYTGVLGFPVMGVWQPYSDGTDINAVDRSPSQEYVVTADDFGKVTVKVGGGGGEWVGGCARVGTVAGQLPSMPSLGGESH